MKMIKPCPICGTTKYLRITSKEDYEQNCINFCLPPIRIKCDLCLVSLPCNRIRNFDEALDTLIRIWNGRIDRGEKEIAYECIAKE